MSQVVAELPFVGSIDEGTRPEYVDPRKSALVIQNARVGQTGGLKLRKGYDQLTSARLDTSTRTTGDRLIRLPNGAPAIIDGHLIDVYSEQGYNITRDRIPECSVRRFVASGLNISDWVGTTVYGQRVEYCNGYYVVIWVEREDGASTYRFMSVVLDADSGLVIRGPEAVLTAKTYDDLDTAAHDGTYVHLVYRSAANTASSVYLDVTSSSTINSGWSSPVSLFTDLASLGTFQCVTLDSETATRAAIGYVDTAATPNAVLATFDETGILETLVTADADPNYGVGLGGTWSTYTWFSYVDGSLGDTNALAADPTDLTTSYTVGGIHVGTALSSMMWAVASSTSAVLFGLSGGLTWATTVVEAGGTVVTSGTIQKNGTWMVARPQRVGGRDYACVDDNSLRSGSSDGNGAITMCDVSSPATGQTVRPVAFAAPRLERTTSSGYVRNLAVVSSTKLVTTCVTVRSQSSMSIELVEFDFADRERWSRVSASDLAVIGGGLTTVFDGARAHELGFLHPPKAPSGYVKVGAGSITVTTVRWIAAVEQSDSVGNWHVSAVSAPSEAISLAAQNVTWDVSMLPITARQDSDVPFPKARIALYRQQTTGGPYYRCGTTTAEVDPTVRQVTLTDSTADVSSNAALYRQPGVVGTPFNRDAPPGLTHLVSYNGMVCGVDDTRRTVWFSAQQVDGEPPWFSPAFSLPMTEGGDITGLGVLDGTLVVFKRRAVYVVNGITPSDNGQQGGFGDPRKLSVEFGCISHRSIVSTPLGLMYRSDRGIELLDRAQQVTEIGYNIQKTLETYPEVMAATLVAHQDVVIFECCQSVSGGRASGNGVSIVFDLTAKTWVSVDVKRIGVSATSHPAQDAAVIFYNGAERYAWLDTSGRVFVEADDHLEADGTKVIFTWVSGWVKVAGIGGEQSVDKVILLAEKATSHDATVSVGYDFRSTYATSRAFTDVEIDAQSGPVWLDVSTGNDRLGQAVRVKVVDAAPSGGGSLGTGQASEWVSVTLEGTGRSGARRTSSGQR